MLLPTVLCWLRLGRMSRPTRLMRSIWASWDELGWPGAHERGCRQWGLHYDMIPKLWPWYILLGIWDTSRKLRVNSAGRNALHHGSWAAPIPSWDPKMNKSDPFHQSFWAMNSVGDGVKTFVGWGLHVSRFHMFDGSIPIRPIPYVWLWILMKSLFFGTQIRYTIWVAQCRQFMAKFAKVPRAARKEWPFRQMWLSLMRKPQYLMNLMVHHDFQPYWSALKKGVCSEC